MTDRNSDQAAATPAEGVRILGAEEAQAAISGSQPTLDLTQPERASSDEPPRRRVAYPDGGPSWSASPEPPEGDDGGLVFSASDDVPEDVPGAAPAAPDEPPSGEVPPLPHWTEPPTGAVPAIFSDDTGEQHAVEDDFDAWATVTGAQPRFRSEGSDWAEADFQGELATPGEQEKLGALDEQGPVDEEAAFAEALDEKRRRPAARKAKARAVTVSSEPRPRRHHEPELSPPGPTHARDLPTAILTGVTVGVAALICFSQGPGWTAVLASLVVGLASLEFCGALRSKGMRCATLLAFTASLTLPFAAKHYGTGAYPVYFGLIVVFSMLWFLWKVTPGRPLSGIATTVLAFGYVGGLGGFAGLSLGRPSGVGIILGVVLCVIAYDVVGFFVGSQWGRTPIAPEVSPHKSVQGTVAGMLASVFIGVALAGAISPWDRGSGLLLGVCVAFGAFFGDLCESLIKRDIGLKDFGSIMPGHGGVLDRFDALLFCLPIAYYLAVVVA